MELNNENQFNSNIIADAKNPNNSDVSNADFAKTKKRNKISLALLIVGTILFFLALFLIGLYMDSVIKHLLNTKENTVGTALGMVLSFTYFGTPGLALSFVSSILNIISVAISKDRRIVKIVFMTLSLLLLIIGIVFFGLMYVK